MREVQKPLWLILSCAVTLGLLGLALWRLLG